MATAHVNAMVLAGFLQADYEKMKETGDGITSVRRLFRTLCGGNKDTSKKGDTVGNTLNK